MHYLVRPLVLLTYCAVTLWFVRNACAEPPAGYVLTWSDEFNGTALDGTKWWAKSDTNRSAANVPEAVKVADGNLTITTYTAQKDGTLAHRTGMVTSYGLFEQKFGYFEARIKFSDAPGMWSAFWVQSRSFGDPVDDAAVAGAEIDVVEHRAADEHNNPIAKKAQLAVHWNGYAAAHQTRNTITPDLGLDDGYHAYAVLWDAAGYTFYIDGKVRWTEKRAASISRRPQFLILSSEVEDKSWAGNIPATGYGDLAASTTKMCVDYVRVYAPPSEDAAVK